MKRKYFWLIIVFSSIFLVISYYYVSFVHNDAFSLHSLSNPELSKEYFSTLGNYSISMPKTWSIHIIHDAPEELKYLIETGSPSSPAGPNEYINISKPLDTTLTISEVFSYITDYKKGYSNLTSISNEELTLGNNKGFLLEYTFIEQSIIGNYENHCYEWILTEDVGYIFRFCVDNKKWDEGKPLFLKMIETIKIFHPD